MFLDLRVVSNDYVGFKTSVNGTSSSSANLGLINQRENSTSNYTFRFFESNGSTADGASGSLYAPSSISLSFLDIDKSGIVPNDGNETLRVFTPGQIEFVSPGDGGLLTVVNSPTETTITNSVANVNESGIGLGAPGSSVPQDLNLSNFEEQAAIEVTFFNTSTIDLQFDVLAQNEPTPVTDGSGRNFVFSGAIEFDDNPTVVQNIIPEPSMALFLVWGALGLLTVRRRVTRGSSS